jgi:hypothetical protein
LILSAVSQSMQPLQQSQPQNKGLAQNQLSDEEKNEVRELQARDREVRAHEQAHLSAGGQFITHGATYSYQQGPDGQRYATGGEVGIDTSPVQGDPEATIRKMQAVRAAALAPANPSGQDQQVAAQAGQQAAQAQAEMRSEKPPEWGQLLDLKA